MQNSRRRLDPSYASAELLWYLSRKRTCEALLPYAPKYEKFLHACPETGERVAYGSYGWRLAHNMEPRSHQDMLGLAACLLRGAPDSRQCVIGLWNPSDLYTAFTGECRDVPCTLSFQLLIRDQALHWITTMRSNDVWLGMPYDVYAFTCMQSLLADELGLMLGDYVHNVGSMHLYERNAEAARQSIGCHRETPSHEWTGTAWDIKMAVALEERARGMKMSTAELLGEITRLGPQSLLADAVICCARKWNYVVEPYSPALRRTDDHRRGTRPHREDDALQGARQATQQAR